MVRRQISSLLNVRLFVTRGLIYSNSLFRPVLSQISYDWKDILSLKFLYRYYIIKFYLYSSSLHIILFILKFLYNRTYKIVFLCCFPICFFDSYIECAIKVTWRNNPHGKTMFFHSVSFFWYKSVITTISL